MSVLGEDGLLDDRLDGEELADQVDDDVVEEPDRIGGRVQAEFSGPDGEEASDLA